MVCNQNEVTFEQILLYRILATLKRQQKAEYQGASYDKTFPYYFKKHLLLPQVLQ